MKKILFMLALSASLAYPAVIDSSNAIVKWSAFKTPEKVAVSGTFNDVKFKLNKPNKNGTIESQLNNATATIDINKVELNDEGKNETVRTYFFGAFVKKDAIKVTLKEVFEGKDRGTILATVRMNGKSQKVPMQYEIANSKITAKGVLDISEFGLESARVSLNNECKELHEGITWSQVEIGFEAPVK